ncbi:allantoin permease [Guyanagaster necrorhizus]|uniref:Allantoin permease n=1 Tax=Guyanagaster necrorhizus TaxID=856835 RepID=A0A9P7VRM5_9AGAR|nr:allantoin permease [Guyanagaster necrorhizus MCA 3950]KAG7445403.1 allantoin permease [Guyanagaster necrorhizus MCA 3950]
MADEKDADVHIQTVAARPSLQHAFHSWSSLNRYIKTDAGRNTPGNGHIWENDDLLPSPEEHQTWGTGSFFAFWFAEPMNAGTWAVASSMITLGMTWWHAVLVVFSANMLSSLVLILNGYASSGWYIGFPVLVRTSFGISGSFFAIVVRSMLGIVWFGIQCTFGGYFVSICLRCIWPSWYTIENHIPESIGITSRDLAGFSIFWVVNVGFLFIPPYKTRWLFIAKSFLLPPTGLGILIWALKKNHGFTGMSFGAAQSTGPTLAWAIIAQFNSVMGTNSALLVTIPDITRYARHRSAQTQGQLFSLPLGQTLWATCGIMVTAAVHHQWGTAYWNPYDLLNAMLDYDTSSSARAGCFFASAAFIFSTIGTSIADNTIPFGSDITALLPRHLTIVRGQLLCAVMGFAVFPWRILSGAPGFLTFLNGYSIFMGPVVGIMIVDYFLVRRGNLQPASLYTGARDGAYYYTRGVNWRAIIAFVAGMGVPFPGFVQSFGGVVIGEVAAEIFDLGWLVSFGMGAVIYWVLCRVFPVGNVDGGLSFEAELERMKIEEMEKQIKEEFPDGVPYIY